MFAIFLDLETSSRVGPPPRPDSGVLDCLSVSGPQVSAFDAGGFVATRSASLGAHTLLWDGRLTAACDIEARHRTSGDEALTVLRAYLEHGVELFSRLAGPFACAVVDHASRELILARDPLGLRYLSYASSSNYAAAAVIDSALLGYPGVSEKPDPRRFCGLLAPGLGKGLETCFADISELAPGNWMRLGRQGTRTEAFWSPVRLPVVRYRSSADYAVQFRELLGDSVDRCMDADGAGVLLSGGLDSAPIAALAGAASLRQSRPPPLAVSWRFRDTPGADEGRFIESVRSAAGLPSLDVFCDDCWPFSPAGEWRTHPSFPEQDNYRLKLDAGYRAAAERGVKVLLSGVFGDDLYLPDSRWARRQALAGAWPELWGNLATLAHRDGMRTVLRLLLRSLLPTAMLERRRRRGSLQFLQTRVEAIIAGSTEWPGAAERGTHGDRWARIGGLDNGIAIAQERLFAARHGIELRYPFRDLKLVEFMLGLPLEQYWSAASSRPILRRAFRGLLTDELLERTDKADFMALHRRLFTRGRSAVDAILRQQTAVRERLLRRAADFASPSVSAGEEWIRWRVLALEHWLEHSPHGPSLREGLLNQFSGE